MKVISRNQARACLRPARAWFKKQSSSLSLNDLNRLELRGCKLIRLTGRAIQVSDEADKKLRKFSTSEIPTLRNALKMARYNSQELVKKV